MDISNDSYVAFVGTLINLMQLVHIRRTLFGREQFDLVLISSQIKMKRIYEAKELEKIFDHVYFVDLNVFNKGLDKYYGLFFPETILRKNLQCSSIPKWTNIFFWNPEFIIYTYLWVCQKKRWTYELHLYSDAMAAYITELLPQDCTHFKFPLFKWYMNLGHRVSNLANEKYDMYLFKPNYVSYATRREMIAIPPINKNNLEFLSLINRIFQYDFIKHGFDEKYIFFDDNWDELSNIEEQKKFLKLLQITLGNENLVVKPHPLQRDEYYDGMSLNLLDKTIPWELYGLNNDLSNRKVITAVSSASVMPMIFFDVKQEVFILDFMETPYTQDIMNCFHSLINRINQDEGKKITTILKEDDIKEICKY